MERWRGQDNGVRGDQSILHLRLEASEGAVALSVVAAQVVVDLLDGVEALVWLCGGHLDLLHLYLGCDGRRLAREEGAQLHRETNRILRALLAHQDARQVAPVHREARVGVLEVLVHRDLLAVLLIRDKVRFVASY